MPENVHAREHAIEIYLFRHAGWPKKVNHHQIIKKSYRIAVILSFFVKLKYRSNISIKHSVRDLLCDVINNIWSAK